MNFKIFEREKAPKNHNFKISILHRTDRCRFCGDKRESYGYMTVKLTEKNVVVMFKRVGESGGPNLESWNVKSIEL